LIDGYCSHWLRRLFRPHWAYFGLFRALRAAFVRPAKNARNDVHAVISDWNFFLSRPCQESGGVESQRPYRA
ncbi:MAG: hypothetical protein KHX36_12445, partial [Clostridiales bacterium]|nr:hypothetical protein [Clostridiales bacterium]